MKSQTLATTALALLPLVAADAGWGPWGSGCATDCADSWSDKYFPDKVDEFCSDSSAVSSAASCVAAASCADDKKAQVTSSISSLCSDVTSMGSWPTDAAAWSSWGGGEWGGHGGPGGFGGGAGPWTKGGPFGGGWGPWGGHDGDDADDTGPWTRWWGGDDCPGSSWSGWTDGPWATSAEWTTWEGCSATTTPTVVTTTVDGSQSLITSLQTKVAQVTNGPNGGNGGNGGSNGDNIGTGAASQSRIGGEMVAFGVAAAGIFGMMIAL